MPQIMPTPGELGSLSWHQRDRVRRAVMAIAVEADRVAERQLTRQREIDEWAKGVRDTARALEHYIGRDDPATILARRAAWEER